MRQAHTIVTGRDLGGTKIAAQIFDFSHKTVTFRPCPTPRTDETVIAPFADQMAACKAMPNARLKGWRAAFATD